MKLIKGVIVLAIIGLLGYGVYYYCIKGEKINTHFERSFTLNVLDRAVVDEEVYIKLIGVEDNKCHDEDCEREGEYVAKLIVINDHKMAYLKIGSLSADPTYIEKTDYAIQVTEIKDNGTTTLKVTRN